jgi:poly(A) polymerase
MAKKIPSLTRAKFLRDTNLQHLLAVLNAQGESRIVGGAVRNTLLKRPIADIDIATVLVPQAVDALCRAAGFGVHPTGIEHGTLTITVEGKPFEVTTLRRDVATDGRRATVAFTTDWREDAMRRDFTMNALYCDPHGKIYDFTNGCADTLNQKVRFVGSAPRRIVEDALRILRFFRFSATYGSAALDKPGLAACTRARKKLRNLSPERVRSEMLKLLAAPRAIPTLKAMAKAGILAEILPHKDNWRVLARLPHDPLLRLYALSSKPMDLQHRFRLSNAEARVIEALYEDPQLSPDLTPIEQRRVLYQLGAERWRNASTLAWAESRAEKSDRKWRNLIRLAEAANLPDFPVKGADLIAAGILPGPALGARLARLEDWWIASDFKPTREELLAHARKM